MAVGQFGLSPSVSSGGWVCVSFLKHRVIFRNSKLFWGFVMLSSSWAWAWRHFKLNYERFLIMSALWAWAWRHFKLNYERFLIMGTMSADHFLEGSFATFRSYSGSAMWHTWWAPTHWFILNFMNSCALKSKHSSIWECMLTARFGWSKLIARVP